MPQNKQIVSDLYRSFTTYWGMFNVKMNRATPQTLPEAAYSINQGDCGVAAISVYSVLKRLRYDVTMISSERHALLEIDNLFFDTECPTGADVVPARHGPNPYLPQSIDDMIDGYMPCDSHGAHLMQGWLGLFDIPIPAKLQHAIDNAEQYETVEVKAMFDETIEKLAAMDSLFLKPTSVFHALLRVDQEETVAQ